MSTEPTPSSISRGHRNFLLVTAISTALLITMGTVVCATESGAACPDWPGCYGRAIPPPQIHSIIEYTHRFITAVTTPLIIVAAIIGWRRAKRDLLITRLPIIAVFLTLVVAAFGALIVLTGLARWLVALDIASALIVLTLMVTAATAAYARHADPGLPDRLSAGTRFAALGAVTVAAVFAVYVSAVLVAGTGSLTRCVSWPIWRILPTDVPGWPQVARMTTSALAAFLVVALIVAALREPHAGIRRAAVVGAVAFALEMLIGIIMMRSGATPFLAVAYVTAAVLLWCMLVNIAVLGGFAAAAQAETRQGIVTPQVRSQ